jgi:argininosuccinate lyase
LPDGVDAAMAALNTSVHIDRELWREDIQGSIAHARGLARAGVISDTDAKALVGGLEQIQAEIESGKFTWHERLEDVHMNIESRLIEILGPVGGRLHTGRSRNDQIATDLRLWTRRKCEEALVAVSQLARVILDAAEHNIELLMPAYTHLQPGQPSRVSHHLMAWQELLWRDRGRLEDALERLNECPLGAGAVAGSTFPLDRAGVAEELGFSAPMRNSLDATASRDFLMEVSSALAILGVHLSRIGEEIVLWSSYEFGFVSLSDTFSTSSSMMPQKKNPDVAELVRGRAARLIGDLTSLLVLEKGLTFGYGRDLQEDKLPIFGAFDNVLVSVRALGGAIATMRFNPERLAQSLGRGHLCATDVADLLVTLGEPFRTAHHTVGALVRRAEALGVQIDALPLAEVRAAHPGLTDERIREVFSVEAAVERRKLFGGPARARVQEAIADARSRWG